MNINRQYDNFADDFSAGQAVLNKVNRDIMRRIIGEDLKNKVILDIGCGEGTDLKYYAGQGASCYGIDPSRELVQLARQRLPSAEITIGLAEQMVYSDNFFDFVFSKYAIMTSYDLEPIFNQAHRILKPRGMFIYLCTHPFRQFLEKKKTNADYFQKEVVKSVLFGGRVTAEEPTHTFNEYFNKDFFSRFEMVDYVEAYDPAAEKINGADYPGFFIVKASKKG